MNIISSLFFLFTLISLLLVTMTTATTIGQRSKKRRLQSTFFSVKEQKYDDSSLEQQNQHQLEHSNHHHHYERRGLADDGVYGRIKVVANPNDSEIKLKEVKCKNRIDGKLEYYRFRKSLRFALQDKLEAYFASLQPKSLIHEDVQGGIETTSVFSVATFHVDDAIKFQLFENRRRLSRYVWIFPFYCGNGASCNPDDYDGRRRNLQEKSRNIKQLERKMSKRLERWMSNKCGVEGSIEVDVEVRNEGGR